MGRGCWNISAHHLPLPLPWISCWSIASLSWRGYWSISAPPPPPLPWMRCWSIAFSAGVDAGVFLPTGNPCSKIPNRGCVGGGEGVRSGCYLCHKDSCIERYQHQDKCIERFRHHQDPDLVLQALVVSWHVTLRRLSSQCKLNAVTLLKKRQEAGINFISHCFLVRTFLVFRNFFL